MELAGRCMAALAAKKYRYMPSSSRPVRGLSRPGCSGLTAFLLSRSSLSRAQSLLGRTNKRRDLLDIRGNALSCHEIPRGGLAIFAQASRGAGGRKGPPHAARLLALDPCGHYPDRRASKRLAPLACIFRGLCGTGPSPLVSCMMPGDASTAWFRRGPPQLMERHAVLVLTDSIDQECSSLSFILFHLAADRRKVFWVAFPRRPAMACCEKDSCRDGTPQEVARRRWASSINVAIDLLVDTSPGLACPALGQLLDAEVDASRAAKPGVGHPFSSTSLPAIEIPTVPTASTVLQVWCGHSVLLMTPNRHRGSLRHVALRQFDKLEMLAGRVKGLAPSRSPDSERQSRSVLKPPTGETERASRYSTLPGEAAPVPLVGSSEDSIRVSRAPFRRPLELVAKQGQARASKQSVCKGHHRGQPEADADRMVAARRPAAEGLGWSVAVAATSRFGPRT
ncbi:uncharacterized protein PSFLO_05308 [Pseudozyma flocculosa]|uniref:Uncharacterized protein n=1 Tax=Pseudozyma flocculosa TaxID=84751 RepID=A0A5C3F7Y0_9BASI|nr:uncharacterized protein PSFLO_05308 [Pseudozyma flocculosa]